MIVESTQFKILEKIVQSHEFNISKKYQELLRYLVEASIRNTVIKETVIAMELFGKDSHFDPMADPTVRVYISNLRKKLEQYYLSSGKADEIRLEIPRGQYHVQFIPVVHAKKNFMEKHLVLLSVLSISLILILSTAAVKVWQRHRSLQPSHQKEFLNNPIWTEFIKNDIPTIMVLGDYTFLYRINREENRNIYLRDSWINSQQDYDDYMARNPIRLGKLFHLKFTYLKPVSAWSVYELLPFLSSSGHVPLLKLASELKWNDVENNHVLFVGGFETLYILQSLLTRLNLRYRVTPPQIFQVDDRSDTVNTYHAHFEGDGKSYVDYAVIIKMPGPNKNTIMLITGFEETGILESVKKAVDPSFPSRIADACLHQEIRSPFYFEMLIEAGNENKTGYTSKIRYFKTIDPNFIFHSAP